MRTAGDTGLANLLAELKRYPAQPPDQATRLEGAHPGVLMPFLMHTPARLLHLISTTRVFGSPTDITLLELALETFSPVTKTRQRPCGPWLGGRDSQHSISCTQVEKSWADLSNSIAVPIQPRCNLV